MNQAVWAEITPWVYWSRDFQFGAARLGAVLTRVNGEFLGIFGRNAEVVSSTDVLEFGDCRPFSRCLSACTTDG